MDDALERGNNVSGVVEPTVWIVDDTAPRVSLNSIPVHEPLQRTATVHHILVCRAWDPTEPDVLVDDEFRPVMVKPPHLLGTNSKQILFIGQAIDDDFQGMFGTSLVAEMQGRQTLTSHRECAKARGHGNSRQRLCQVIREALSVGRRMEHTVDVLEDRIFRDPVVAVVLPECTEGCVRDVVDTLQLSSEEFGPVKDTPLDGDRRIGGSTVRTRGSGGRACSWRRGRRTACWHRFRGRR